MQYSSCLSYLTILLQWKNIRLNTKKQSERSLNFRRPGPPSYSVNLLPSLTWFELLSNVFCCIKLWFPLYHDCSDRTLHFQVLSILKRSTHFQKNSSIFCLNFFMCLRSNFVLNFLFAGRACPHNLSEAHGREYSHINDVLANDVQM